MNLLIFQFANVLIEKKWIFFQLEKLVNHVSPSSAAAVPKAITTPMLPLSPQVQKPEHKQIDRINVSKRTSTIIKSAPPSILFQSNTIRQAANAHIPQAYPNQMLSANNMNVQQHPQQLPNRILNKTQISPITAQKNAIASDSPEILSTAETDEFFHFDDGQILTMQDLIANGYKLVNSDANGMVVDNDDENIVSEQAVETRTDDNYANSPPIADTDDKTFALLSKLALRVVKIETNQKAFDRRMERLETGINLILDALSVDRLDLAVQSKAPLNAGQPGAIVSNFKKIANVAELNAFEDKLRNPIHHQEMVRLTIFRKDYFKF